MSAHELAAPNHHPINPATVRNDDRATMNQTIRTASSRS
jgi:hypothetical protein